MGNLKVYKVGEMRDKIVISGVEFQNIQTHETYDRWGQQVGYYEAQACMTILTEAAAEITGVDVGEYIHATDEFFLDVVNECQEGVDFEIDSPEVKAYNYWDGNNWRTLVLETDFGYPDLEEVKGEEAEAILTAYEAKEFYCGGFGCKTYVSGKYTFVEYSSDWYDAEVSED